MTCWFRLTNSAFSAAISPIQPSRFNQLTRSGPRSVFPGLCPQLGQILQRDLPEVPVQLTVVDGRGFCLRFAPLTEPCRPLDGDVLDDWADCLTQQIVSTSYDVM